MTKLLRIGHGKERLDASVTNFIGEHAYGMPIFNNDRSWPALDRRLLQCSRLVAGFLRRPDEAPGDMIRTINWAQQAGLCRRRQISKTTSLPRRFSIFSRSPVSRA
jgi:hypothetical protein